MPEKDPQNYSFVFQVSEIWAYLWVLVLSAWGGAVNFYHKLKTGEVTRWNVTELIGELVTSAFCGVITFFLCRAGGIDIWVSAALVGIAGHMGSRLIFKMEQWAVRRFGP